MILTKLRLELMKTLESEVKMDSSEPETPSVLRCFSSDREGVSGFSAGFLNRKTGPSHKIHHHFDWRGAPCKNTGTMFQ